ncbi:7 transmembrane receptor domain-containing protein [Scyliorhinus canicula]|uniref:7 transmembrane receptor domain-containing protein n=1 Tax=Scyliorhinus canicula TaxID=7830 RepID=UPI0018F46382|nr:7 transmembrane receptor domain-containing protein [Scyliorhinus canicula]XP_038642059.1 7 transmembrane receptor domain-containing protein [Scyliorhinus canicula]
MRTKSMENETLDNSSLFNSSSLMNFPGTILLQKYKSFFILLYCALVAVACVGNVFLVGSIIGDKKLHNATNFFIGNLSVTDLLMCLTCVPLTLSYAFELRGWLFGRFMCHFVSLMQSAMVYVSVLSLTAIAVDRYIVVAYPIRQRVTLSCCALIVGGIWALSLALASPASIYATYVELKVTGNDVNICEEFWRGMETERLAYSCVVILVSYMIPLLAVTISYCAITVHLKRRNVPGAVEQNQVRWNRKKRKTFFLLVISVVTFAICWMPLQILNLIRDLDVDFTIIDTRYINVVQVSCHWVAMSSSCYNPFIYASLHRKFRLQLRGYFRRWKRPSSFPSTRLSPFHTSISLVSEGPKAGTDNGSYVVHAL